ncbi:MAG: recombinase [Marinilabiliales bacterium]|nr:MAG: recombinase [Marinilabiliales bacterium]
MEKRTTLNLLFYVRKTRLLKNGEAPVYMRITVNGVRKDLALNQGINPKLWDSVKGKASGNSKNARSLNLYFESIRVQLRQHMINMREENIPITALTLKNRFQGKSTNAKYLIEMFKEHNENIQKLSGIDFAPNTISKYKTTLFYTQLFLKLKYKCDDINIKDVNHTFLTNYEYYLKTERKCSHNTAMRYIKDLRKIVRIALSNGWIGKDPFANYKIKFHKVDRGFLTEDELHAIINKTFTINRLEQVKDCFLFSCFTGLAHIDLKRLTPQHIFKDSNNKLWLKVNRKKTNSLCSVPLLPVALQLIEKYENNPYCVENNLLLPVLSNQSMNAYLKEIADICGITKRLSSHLARHTFATTITLNNDVPIETVSKMLGHSSISVTKIYARLLDKKVGRDMQHLNDKFTLS